MDNLLIDLKTASTKEIVNVIMNNYHTVFFIGILEGKKSKDVTKISVLTVLEELEDDAKFIQQIMYYARQGKINIKEHYWAKANELCTELVQQAKEDYYYE